MSTSRRRFILLVAALAVTAGCGPSAAQLRQAREAQYEAPRAEVFRLAHAAVASEYGISAADPATGIIVTETRTYEPDGSSAGTGDQDRAGGMAVRTESGAVILGFRVIVLGEAPPFRVRVEPVAQQMRANYSAPYTYLADDPAMPGWILGKVDNLQLDVHRRLARSLPAPSVVAQK